MKKRKLKLEHIELQSFDTVNPGNPDALKGGILITLIEACTRVVSQECTMPTGCGGLDCLPKF